MLIRLGRVLFFVAAVCGLVLGARADKIDVGDYPGISGLAKLEDNVYLAVHDEKVKDDAAKEGPRATIISMKDPDKTTVETPVIDWSPIPGGRPNDLESVCAIEGKPGEYITVESGHRGPKYGRIIHLRADNAAGKWTISVLGTIYLPDQMPDGAACKEIEGAQTFVREGTTYLLLGYRGKDEKKGRLAWGKLDWGHAAFHIAADLKFYTPMVKMKVPGERRYCSDLLLLHGEIYAPSCNDPGDDGPFTSAVYHLGHINFTGPATQMIHLIPNEQIETIRYEGHKVEALAPASTPNGLWLAGTDDENLKGTLYISSNP